jgi:hypothetical protein
MSHTYRQTISDEMAAKLAAICEERGVSLQELTLIALYQLLGQDKPRVSPPVSVEETRGDYALSFD